MKFVLKVCSHFLLLVAFLEFLAFILIGNFELSTKLGVKKEFQNILELTKKVNGPLHSDTLFLGDSVGRQIYPTGVQDNFVTSTGSTLVHGNLILLKKAVFNNPELKVVNYIVTPGSLGLDLRYGSASSGCIKPFMSIYRPSDINEIIVTFLKSKPLSFLYLLNVGKFLPISDIKFSSNYNDDYILSDYAISSLKEMVTFCSERNIIFNLVSPPIPDLATEKVRLNNFKLKTMSDPILNDIINKYLDTIRFLPRSMFKDDLHFSRSYLRSNRKAMRSKISKNFSSAAN